MEFIVHNSLLFHDFIMQPSNYEHFRLFLERLSSACNFAPMVLCKVNANLSTRRLFIYILSALIDALIIANT